jgi:hypothetical protein
MDVRFLWRKFWMLIWVFMPCNIEGIKQCFGGTNCLKLQSRIQDKLFRNVDENLKHYTA